MRSLLKTWSCLLVAVALSGWIGCGGSGGKGSESDMPVDGSADSWRSPTLHGDLVFGQPNPAEFDGAAFYHAWDFSLSGAAEVELEVDNPSDYFDTVMYLYRSDAAGSDWGTYLERNDDQPESLRSRIAVSLDVGLYRVMVKGYSQSLEGDFSIIATCAGEGCVSQNLDVCLFGQDMAELGQRTGYSPNDWSAVDAVSVYELSAILQEQIVLGASQMEGRPMDLAEAVDYNDDREIRYQAFDAEGGRQFVAYSYYLGDTLVGFVFPDGETVQAMVQDGYLESCHPSDLQGGCLFGQELFELEQDPAFELGEPVSLAAGGLDQLSPIRLQQLLLGIESLEGLPASFPDYWDMVDDGIIQMRDLTAADGRQFVLFAYYQGDTRVGFLFQAAGLVQATIGDGEIGDCVALVAAD